MSELEQWFGTREPRLPMLPKRCSWISLYTEYAVIGFGRGKTKRIDGDSAKLLRDALTTGAYRPLNAGTSKNGATIYYHA